MRLEKAEKRDKKRNKRRHGMRVTGKSIFTIVGAQVHRAERNRSGTA